MLELLYKITNPIKHVIVAEVFCIIQVLNHVLSNLQNKITGTNLHFLLDPSTPRCVKNFQNFGEMTLRSLLILVGLKHLMLMSYLAASFVSM